MEDNTESDALEDDQNVHTATINNGQPPTISFTWDNPESITSPPTQCVLNETTEVNTVENQSHYNVPTS